MFKQLGMIEERINYQPGYAEMSDDLFINKRILDS